MSGVTDNNDDNNNNISLVNNAKIISSGAASLLTRTTVPAVIVKCISPLHLTFAKIIFFLRRGVCKRYLVCNFYAICPPRYFCSLHTDLFFAPDESVKEGKTRCFILEFTLMAIPQISIAR